MAKLRPCKVSYVIDCKWSETNMRLGEALMCAARTDQIETIIGKAAVVCLENERLMLCEILKGSSEGVYDLEVLDHVVMKGARIRWAEPLVGRLMSYEWQRLEKEDLAECIRLAASLPVPVLQVGKRGRAICRTTADA